MRARCERHQLALGPNGCVLCRREAAAPAVVPGPTAGLPGADTGEVSVTAVESQGPRRIHIQVPGVVLLLPLLAGAFYFFALFAGNDHASNASAAAALAREPAAITPSAERPRSPAGDSATPASRGFPALVIEEPAAADRRPLDGAPAERPAAPATAARNDAANARQLARARKEAEALELAEMRERVDVIVYSTTWCPACRSLRAYLDKRGIRATEYDIERNRSAQARQRELNPRGGVPTVEIDGQVLVGFSPRIIEAALDRAARARLQRL